MADQNEEHRAQVRRQMERQYEIDRITFQYVEEHRAGRAPRIEDYMRRYPDYAHELREFALYYHIAGIDIAAQDALPEADLSPAAQRALAQIREERAPTAAPVTPIAGLVKEGSKAGYSPKGLAEAVRLTTDVLAKLEAHAIDAATIPTTLIERLSAALRVTPAAVAAYLGGSGPAQAGAFYYADKSPEQRQESFLDAVRQSALAPEMKQEWTEIVQHNTPGDG